MTDIVAYLDEVEGWLATHPNDELTISDKQKLIEYNFRLSRVCKSLDQLDPAQADVRDMRDRVVAVIDRMLDLFAVA